jgi:hypothetical protein
MNGKLGQRNNWELGMNGTHARGIKAALYRAPRENGMRE